MAGKPKSMSLIKQLLKLYRQGYKIKRMARELGISKNTVKSYLSKTEENKWNVEDLIALENPELEAKFHAGHPAYKDDRYDQLKGQLDDLVKELGKRGVTKNLLWEEYRQQYPKGYSRSQFCYHLSQHIRAGKRSMILQHQAGEKLYIDFAGDKMHYIDPFSGAQIECPVLVCCLPFSDYGFALALSSEKSEELIEGLKTCLQHIGGVPQVLVPDNMKTAVIKANRYEPEINQILQDFADHYGAAVLPTRVRKPKDKALVEDHVKLVYTRVYAKLRNQKFYSLTELNMAIQEKMREHNQTRMQEKPYCREEKFIAEEKGLLKALPAKPFEIKCYTACTVRANNHVRLGEDRHYYSVPYTFIGKKVKIIYTKNMVWIYCKGQQIAVHVRQHGPGQYTSQRDHLCSQHQHYLDRSPQYYLQRAGSRSHQMYQLFEHIFQQGKYPEQLYNTCDGILNLYRKADHHKINKACQIALDHKNYSYKFILNILQNNMVDHLPKEEEKKIPDHQNIRGQSYYR